MPCFTVKAPGSCGELAQGSINGRDFLITCPIDCYTEVTVKLDVAETSLPRNPVRPKTCLAVAKTLQHFKQLHRPYHISVVSQLPMGKGMASSSADIGAACYAAALNLGKMISARTIAKIALSIEPTDAVFCRGVVLFDHRQGKSFAFLGNPPDLELLIFDLGGMVDTLSFNRCAELKTKNRQKEHLVKEAVQLIKTGLVQHDPYLIAKGATLSALANQQILTKAGLEEIIHFAQQRGALGINAAHSGTVIGIMLDSQNLLSRSEFVTEITTRFTHLHFLQRAKLIGGGMTVLTQGGGGHDEKRQRNIRGAWR